MTTMTVAQGWYWRCPVCGEHDFGFISQEYAQKDADRHARVCEGE